MNFGELPSHFPRRISSRGDISDMVVISGKGREKSTWPAYTTHAFFILQVFLDSVLATQSAYMIET